MRKTPLRRKSQLKRTPIKRKAFENTVRKSTRSTPMKRCDDLFRVIIRARGRCERCNTMVNLQCAHIQPRSYHGPRHDEDNALCLCLGCHVYFHHHPAEFVMFVGEEKWLELLHRALADRGVKINWKEREALLRQRAHHMGVT